MTQLETVERTLAIAGLRPVVDIELGLVRADCPECGGGGLDPHEIWRPMTVVVEQGGDVQMRCDCCHGSARV